MNSNFIDLTGAHSKGSVNEHREALIEKLSANPNLAAAVADALAAAGSEVEWTSETIEYVLVPFRQVLHDAGAPWIGTSIDVNALQFWCNVAGIPNPCDPYEGDQDDAQRDWAAEVADGDTLLGLAEWWAKRIEENS